MVTPRKRRKTSSSMFGSRDEFRDQLDALKRVKPDRDADADGNDPDRPLTPREEYRAALDELNRYSHNNETAEAIDARQRFDRADRNRRRLWGRGGKSSGKRSR